MKNDSHPELKGFDAIGLDLRQVPKPESENTYDSASTSNSGHNGNENSKEPSETNTFSRCDSANSTESADDQRSPGGKVLVKDANYREKRMKNNLAAKKSRDAKRQREIEMKNELVILREENIRLNQALSGCACGILIHPAAVYYPGPLQISYQNPQFFPVTNDLGS